jgi:hypothetical protein
VKDLCRGLRRRFWREPGRGQHLRPPGERSASASNVLAVSATGCAAGSSVSARSASDTASWTWPPARRTRAVESRDDASSIACRPLAEVATALRPARSASSRRPRPSLATQRLLSVTATAYVSPSRSHSESDASSVCAASS